MGVILSYSLFSSILLMLLYLAYKWVMAGENQHTFNRVTLWGIYVVALLAPLAVSLIGSGAADPMVEAMEADMVGEVDYPATLPAAQPVQPASPLWPTVVLWIYIAGIVAVVGHTLLVGFRLRRVIRGGEVVDLIDGYRIVVTDNEGIAPFSWCRYVVMNRRDYTENGDMILVHELRHLGLGHWMDLLLAQMVGIVQWFNPAAWLMREELKTVHEYQADSAVLAAGVSARDYQMLLVCKALGSRFPSLANCLNHSKLKKRITMMYDGQTSPLRRLRSLILVPALGVAFFVADLDVVASVIAETAGATFGRGLPFGAEADDDPAMPAMLPEAGTEPDERSGQPSVAADEPVIPEVESVEKKESRTDEAGRQSADDGIADERITDDAGESQAAAGDATERSDDASDVKIPDATVTDGGDRSAADSDDRIFTVVEQKPRFPGGERALLMFVTNNLRYPAEAFDAGIEGRVVIQFVVGKDGYVGDVRVIRSIEPSLDAEAVRVAKMIPRFSPGRLNGKPAAVWYTLPVTFKIKRESPSDPVDTKIVEPYHIQNFSLEIDGRKANLDDVEVYIDGVLMADGERAIASVDTRRIASIDVFKNPDRIHLKLKPETEAKSASSKD